MSSLQPFYAHFFSWQSLVVGLLVVLVIVKYVETASLKRDVATLRRKIADQAEEATRLSAICSKLEAAKRVVEDRYGPKPISEGGTQMYGSWIGGYYTDSRDIPPGMNQRGHRIGCGCDDC